MAVFLGEDALEVVICRLGDVSEPRGQQNLKCPPVVLKWCWADCWRFCSGQPGGESGPGCVSDSSL